eukprot:CAMPEP_0119149126 /NCGR_PEP_ID=MMETSP1310-20130426/42901_1 /TAXON_ID=464262 /ORGANISM="Genus nov. species nov., Strain RCC2339" /LENGTH=306 /DNA_ID=CAMNT_0007141209 /DNA_START=284 /DNA_END=1201 /DNA_ORIENTATION=+
MCTNSAIERISYELAQDQWNDGVHYVEVRFAPQLHVNSKHGVTVESAIESVHRGLQQAAAEINASLGDSEPEFRFGIIACILRSIQDMHGRGLSEYYEGILEADRTAEHASVELVEALISMREQEKYQSGDETFPVVAIDIAGAEIGFPAMVHDTAYRAATQELLLSRTVHAGEAVGPESIFEAVAHLHAHRVGHGIRIFDTEHLHEVGGKKLSGSDRRRFVEQLVKYVVGHDILFEVCLTSNYQTCPTYASRPQDHPLRRMLDGGLTVTLGVDNSLMSHTCLSREYGIAIDNHGVSRTELQQMIW